ncbi:MAG: preprotein translocase subunit SecG [Myxococcota bacterium]|jgi:preprotein translocase subunit SecG
MVTLLTVIHVIAAIFLVLVVLLQTGKGASLGAAFGGSSQTVFGASGAGNFMTKLTAGSAVVFMFTSLSLAYLSSHSDSSIEKALRQEQAITEQKPSGMTTDKAPAAVPVAPASEKAPSAPATAK